MSVTDLDSNDIVRKIFLTISNNSLMKVFLLKQQKYILGQKKIYVYIFCGPCNTIGEKTV